MTAREAVPLSAALVLSMAADDVAELGWCRSVGDLPLGLAADGTEWMGRGDARLPARLTLLGALHRQTGVEVLCWADLVTAPMRPLWDALVLAVAAQTGVWDAPVRGLDQARSVLAWERDVATHGDVVVVLRMAAELARRGAVAVECPWCACDSRPGETLRGEPCPMCHGLAAHSLHPRRWALALVI